MFTFSYRQDMYDKTRCTLSKSCKALARFSFISQSNGNELQAILLNKNLNDAYVLLVDHTTIYARIYSSHWSNVGIISTLKAFGTLRYQSIAM